MGCTFHPEKSDCLCIFPPHVGRVQGLGKGMGMEQTHVACRVGRLGQRGCWCQLWDGGEDAGGWRCWLQLWLWWRAWSPERRVEGVSTSGRLFLCSVWVDLMPKSAAYGSRLGDAVGLWCVCCCGGSERVSWEGR